MEEFLLGPLGGMFALGFSAGAVSGYGFAVRVHTKALIEAATAPLSVKIEHLEKDVGRLLEENKGLHETINTLFERIIGKDDDHEKQK